jgi:hypothetical protein
VGDYIGNGHEDLLFEMLSESLIPARDIIYKHSSQFYIVYINNLTERMVGSFTAGLSIFPYYAGYVDTTFSSRFKTCLSTILVNAYIKHRKVIIFGHEEDRDDADDVNMLGYPFEDFGYTIRSIRDDLKGVLLSYKIERPVFRGFEADTEFSLNSVTPTPLPLTEFQVQIDESKFGYLTREKTETLRRIGLLGGNPSQLQRMIAERIASNYIYGMSYDDEHGTAQFNIMLEIKISNIGRPFRVLAGLKYLPERKLLSPITLF